MKSFIFLITCLLSLNTFSVVAQTKITVAAATNLSSVAEQLKSAFEKKFPNNKLEFVFGASGALATQIENGAPFHVFMSADLDFPNNLYTNGLAKDKPIVYARGVLILFSKNGLENWGGLKGIDSPAVTQFAIANITTAPYGKAAYESLVKIGLWEKVKSKAVYAQTISQAVQYTIEATTIGFINKSALFTKDLLNYLTLEGKNWLEVDKTLYSSLEQSYIVLKSAENNAGAMDFAKFLVGPEARKVFSTNGYTLP